MRRLYHNTETESNEQLDQLWERFLNRVYPQPSVVIDNIQGRVLFDWNPIDEWSLAQLQAELTRARLRFTLDPQGWLADRIHLLRDELHRYDVESQFDRDEDMILYWGPREPLTPDPPKPKRTGARR